MPRIHPKHGAELCRVLSIYHNGTEDHRRLMADGTVLGAMRPKGSVSRIRWNFYSKLDFNLCPAAHWRDLKLAYNPPFTIIHQKGIPK